MSDKMLSLWIGLFISFWLFVGTLIPVIARMADVFPGDNLGIFIGVMPDDGIRFDYHHGCIRSDRACSLPECAGQ